MDTQYLSQARIPSSSATVQGRVKLKAPPSKGHECRRGASADPQSQPQSLSTSRTKFEDMLQTLSSNAESFKTKQHVLKRAASQCPSVSIEFLGLQVPSLLDLGSMVTLVCEGYFTKNILPLLQSLASNLTEAHLHCFGSQLPTIKLCCLKVFRS